MLDIAKCLNHDCPRKETCLRYETGTPNKYQTYALFDIKGKCEYYIPKRKEAHNEDVLRETLHP